DDASSAANDLDGPLPVLRPLLLLDGKEDGDEQHDQQAEPAEETGHAEEDQVVRRLGHGGLGRSAQVLDRRVGGVVDLGLVVVVVVVVVLALGSEGLGEAVGGGAVVVVLDLFRLRLGRLGGLGFFPGRRLGGRLGGLLGGGGGDGLL